MKTGLFFLIFLPFLFSGCTNKDKAEEKPQSADIISRDEMKNVMVDIFLAEAASGEMELKKGHGDYYTKHYYGLVLKEHNLSKEQFLNNYSYYSSDSEQMLKLMTEVIDDLSQMQSTIGNK